jgi:PTH1 family peptidyl-tRNA hydrolase
MNLSGNALRYWMQELKIDIDRVIVLVDDKDLPFGKVRLKTKGSAGGHNGLKNIELVLGNPQYNRLRFGIGNDFSRGKQIDYVLGNWSAKEQEELSSYMNEAIIAIENYIHLGMAKAMELTN